MKTLMCGNCVKPKSISVMSILLPTAAGRGINQVGCVENCIYLPHTIFNNSINISMQYPCLLSLSSDICSG